MPEFYMIFAVKIFPIFGEGITALLVSIRPCPPSSRSLPPPLLSLLSLVFFPVPPPLSPLLFSFLLLPPLVPTSTP